MFFQIVILCTTAVIFGTCMWFALQSVARTSLVYVPAVIFACMSSLLTLITPMLLQELNGNDKVRDQSENGLPQIDTSLQETNNVRSFNTLFITCLQRNRRIDGVFSSSRKKSTLKEVYIQEDPHLFLKLALL